MFLSPTAIAYCEDSVDSGARTAGSCANLEGSDPSPGREMLKRFGGFALRSNCLVADRPAIACKPFACNPRDAVITWEL